MALAQAQSAPRSLLFPRDIPALPSHVLRYSLQAELHRIGLQPTTEYAYVSDANTVHALVYQNDTMEGATTINKPRPVVSLDDEIQRFELGLDLWEAAKSVRETCTNH